MPRLTLCLIARDEERMLPGCLESVRGVVDEIVLVDTGSRDATMEVARRSGARVYQRPWDEDFAAPRNEALAHALGDFVLHLDADERLVSGGESALRAAMARSDLYAGTLTLHNASRMSATTEEIVSGEARLGPPHWIPRLLRRTADLRYEGIIHESVNESLAARGARLIPVAAHIVHLGAVPDHRIARSKFERNVRLLRRRIELEPDSVTGWGYLALEIMDAGKMDEALRIADEGWALVDRQPRHRSIHLLAAARAATALHAGDPARALESASRTLAREGTTAEMEFFRGVALELLAVRQPAGSAERCSHFAEAALAYRAALEPRTKAECCALEGGDPPTTWGRLGNVLLACDRPGPAREAFEAALVDRPTQAIARIGLAELDLLAGSARGCLERVEPLLGPHPDAWLLAAAAAHALGADDDARIFLARAWERRADYLGLHRIERHNQLAAALGRASAG